MKVGPCNQSQTPLKKNVGQHQVKIEMMAKKESNQVIYSLEGNFCFVFMSARVLVEHTNRHSQVKTVLFCTLGLFRSCVATRLNVSLMEEGLIVLHFQFVSGLFVCVCSLRLYLSFERQHRGTCLLRMNIHHCETSFNETSSGTFFRRTLKPAQKPQKLHLICKKVGQCQKGNLKKVLVTKFRICTEYCVQQHYSV